MNTVILKRICCYVAAWYLITSIIIVCSGKAYWNLDCFAHIMGHIGAILMVVSNLHIMRYELRAGEFFFFRVTFNRNKQPILFWLMGVTICALSTTVLVAFCFSLFRFVAPHR